MPYPALPDRASPYDINGAVVKVVTAAQGTIQSLNAAEMLELNDVDLTRVSTETINQREIFLVIFLPDPIEVTGLFALTDKNTNPFAGPSSIEGSNNTSNGLDGSWVSGTGSLNDATADFDSWRKSVADVDFSSTEYATYRIKFDHRASTPDAFIGLTVCHLYGVPTTPTAEADLPILFLDPDAADAEFTLPHDFGDTLAGTSTVKGFKIKNNHGSLQATTVSLDVNDPDDIIRISTTSGGPWVLTIAVGNIAAGASSAEHFIKSEPGAPPIDLKPVRAAIEVTVGSWV